MIILNFKKTLHKQHFFEANFFKNCLTSSRFFRLLIHETSVFSDLKVQHFKIIIN